MNASRRDWRLIAAGVLAVLRLPQAACGVLVAGLAAGGVAGSLLADRIGRRWGAGHAIAASLWASVLAYAGMGLASHGAVGFALLALVGAAAMVWNVLTASFRQAVVPSRLQGRINSVYRGATWGVIPIGAAQGGAAADHLGLRTPFLSAPPCWPSPAPSGCGTCAPRDWPRPVQPPRRHRAAAAAR